MVHMNDRQLKALKRVLLMALFLALPLGLIVKYHSQVSRVGEDYGSVGEIFFESVDRMTGETVPFTKIHLKNKISLIAVIPEDCTSCTSEPFGQLAEIARSALRYRFKSREQARISWQLLFLAMGDFDPGEPWVRLRLPKIRSDEPKVLSEHPDNIDVIVSELAAGRSLPSGQISWILIDQNGNIVEIFENTRPDMARLVRIWSKSTFNYYLSDYLSKRTFFGPKKNG